MSDEINTLEDLQAVAGSGAATIEVDLATREPVRDELGRSYATGNAKMLLQEFGLNQARVKLQ